MERKIFCIIGERYKCVKFVKENHLSDAECLRQALGKARASDYILDNMMKGKGIVLQRVIPGKSRVCDIEEDDEICTDSDVTVLLVDLNPTSQIPVAIATTSSTIMDCAQNIETGDIMEIDIPILFEKKADADNLALNGTDVQVRHFRQSLIYIKEIFGIIRYLVYSAALAEYQQLYSRRVIFK